MRKVCATHVLLTLIPGNLARSKETTKKEWRQFVKARKI